VARETTPTAPSSATVSATASHPPPPPPEDEAEPTRVREDSPPEDEPPPWCSVPGTLWANSQKRRSTREEDAKKKILRV
jgi:hypothetical protein